jgi:hypothetical protein
MECWGGVRGLKLGECVCLARMGLAHSEVKTIILVFSPFVVFGAYHLITIHLLTSQALVERDGIGTLTKNCVTLTTTPACHLTSHQRMDVGIYMPASVGGVAVVQNTMPYTSALSSCGCCAAQQRVMCVKGLWREGLPPDASIRGVTVGGLWSI